MPILFSAIANRNKLFYKYASCDGNFDDILEEVLNKISWRNNKMTYYHGRYLFHYIIEEEFIYFCITDKQCQRSRAFLFLNEIKRIFEPNTKDFACTLAKEMYRYNEDYSTIEIRKGEIDELNTIGVDSSESILGEKILFVSNDNNLRYTTISYVEKTPEHVEISIKETNMNIFISATFVIVLITMMLILSPMSFATIILLFFIYPFFKKK